MSRVKEVKNSRLGFQRRNSIALSKDLVLKGSDSSPPVFHKKPDLRAVKRLLENGDCQPCHLRKCSEIGVGHWKNETP